MTEAKRPGRPKGSTKKAQSEPKEPKVPKAASSVERPNMTPDQERALLMQAVNKVLPLNKKIESLIVERRALYKQIKAEDGITAKDINETIHLRTGDPEKIKADLERKIQLVEWTHPGIQAELFGATDRTPSIDKADALGEAAGFAGEACSPPYGAGSPQGQKWIAAWHRGQEKLFGKGIKKLDDGPEYVDDDDINEDLRSPNHRHADNDPLAEVA